MKQFTELMKLKKKEGQNVDASVFLRRKNKISWEEIKDQIEYQGLKKTSSEIFSPGDTPHMCTITQTLLLMPRSAYWQEPHMDVEPY